MLSHIRWVRKHFLTDPIVQRVEPKVRIKGRCLIVNNPRFKAGLSLVFIASEKLNGNSKVSDVIERINTVERLCNQRIVARESKHKWTSKIEAIENG